MDELERVVCVAVPAQHRFCYSASFYLHFLSIHADVTLEKSHSETRGILLVKCKHKSTKCKQIPHLRDQ